MRIQFAILVSVAAFGLGLFAAELPLPGRSEKSVLVADADQGVQGSAEDVEIGEASIPGPLRQFRVAAVAPDSTRATAASGDPALDRYVAGDQVALRAGPNVRSRLLRRLDTGARMTEIERQKSWVRLRAQDDGTEGWMHKSYVVTNDPTTAPNG